MVFMQNHMPDVNHIKDYDNTKFVIGETEYTTSIIVSADAVVQWNVQNIDELTPDLCVPLLDTNASVILLGSGSIFKQPSQEIHQYFLQHSRALEVMDTGAACRTYNVLVADGRDVVVGLIR